MYGENKKIPINTNKYQIITYEANKSKTARGIEKEG